MLRSYMAELQLLIAIIGICMPIISFFLVRTLRQIDGNQAKLFNKFEEHEKRLSMIEGEHKVYTSLGGHN